VVQTKRESASRDSTAYSASRSIAFHWPLYIFEGAELALFMISACVFTVILFGPSFPVQNKLPHPALRRLLMGASMGLTAILIIYSSMGKRSGAHFNPAITLTYLRLRKISRPDGSTQR
jgi:aquaporin Z